MDAVIRNDWTRDEIAALFDLPFDVPIGGAKQSGIGRHQGLAGVEEFTQIRIVNAALG